MKLVLYIEVPDGAEGPEGPEGPVYPLVGSALRQYVAQVAANNQEGFHAESQLGLDGGPNEYRVDNGVLVVECVVGNGNDLMMADVRARKFATWIKERIGLG